MVKNRQFWVILACAICLGIFSLCLVLTLAQRPRVVSSQQPSNSTSSRTTEGSLIKVAASGNLQAALNSAKPGDTIVLQSGASYVGSFTLPVKRGTEYITIQSSRIAEMPEGVRVTPQQAPLMAKIQAPSTEPAIRAGINAHHYKFTGLEFTTTSGGVSYGVVTFGEGDTAGRQKTVDQAPHHLIIDRCYIHGAPAQNVQRGVTLNSAETSVLNSHISEVHWAGADSQAVGGWNGPGPFHIVNNHLEAAGENVMFGGALPAIPNLVPSDIEIRRNYVYKPARWRVGDPTYDGSSWTIKNLLELKNARRVTIEGNVFENNWAQAQVGFAILFNCIDDSGSWARIEDVSFTNNIVRHSGNGFNLRGRDDIGAIASRITIKNNLFEDISRRWGGSGILFQLLRGASDVVLEHNTAINDGAALMLDGEPHSRLSVRDNIAIHNTYGVFGNGGYVGKEALDRYARSWSFDRNVLIGLPSDIAPNRYPPNNYFPISMEQVGFFNRSSGDYRLAQSSRYIGKATDGSDIGCNITALQSATKVGGSGFPTQ